LTFLELVRTVFATRLNPPEDNEELIEYTNKQTNIYTKGDSDKSLDLFNAPQEKRPLLNNI